ncbi:MAG TPA: hypothetical protein VLB76_02415 [Thermoanaerobaculia bacterium]|jgi:hypothetical protein|nr:hypothetical protein [Thermoanaerobaculia bacterium]
MSELEERESIVEELIDEIVPEGVDWQRLVVRYPIASLLVAAAGGFFLGRRHGPEVVGALSTFAAGEVSRNVGQLFDQD